MIDREDYLYHFTSAWHIEQIFKSGFLNLTESNLLPPTGKTELVQIGEIEGKPAMTYRDSTFDYKPVVWLTREDNPAAHLLGIANANINKSEIRITLLKTPEFEPWRLFADRNRMNSSWRKKMERGMNPSSWYICEHVIPLSTFVKVENMITGEIYQIPVI